MFADIGARGDGTYPTIASLVLYCRYLRQLEDGSQPEAGKAYAKIGAHGYFDNLAFTPLVPWLLQYSCAQELNE